MDRGEGTALDMFEIQKGGGGGCLLEGCQKREKNQGRPTFSAFGTWVGWRLLGVGQVGQMSLPQGLRGTRDAQRPGEVWG